MKAVYIREFGGSENLEIRDVEMPGEPTGTQVLVRVHAAGLNRADLLQRRGHYPPPPGYSPNIPGLEFAGEVVKTGENARSFGIGERVFAITAGEAQAEFLVIDESLLVRIPDNLAYAEAAAIPEAFITAHDAIFTLGGLQPEETLVIHAVGSGVGLAALQMARAKGANVVGTSRTPEKLERSEEFGLSRKILTGGKADFASAIHDMTANRGADVILDLVGADFFEQNLESLAIKGRLILVGLQSGSAVQFNLQASLVKRLTIIGTVLRGRTIEEKALATRRFAEDILPLLASGAVRPNVDRIFKADDVREAHQYLESNASFGKIILEF